jgi:hypothetical protein
MLSPLRNRFGIPGVISVIALVFAMLGGAYAASNNGGDQLAEASKKNRKHKKKKVKRGPRGKRGPQGPAGPAGPGGPQGAKGDKGDAGANGSDGAAGSDGKSILTREIEIAEVACNGFGGIEVEVEGSGEADEVCNGEEGPQGVKGDEGDPWTSGGTLPTGATETGTWIVSDSNPLLKLSVSPTFAIEYRTTSISFPIPLKTAAAFKYVKKTGTPPSQCNNDEHPGEPSVTNPEASPGTLCVYTSTNSEIPDSPGITAFAPATSVPGTEPSGALLARTVSAGTFFGTWAVTGN